MKKILLLVMLSIVALPALVFAARTGTLDGKTYSGQLGMDGDQNGDPDEFIFSNGTFDSTACHQYGYGKGSYEAKTMEEAMTFKAETKSKEGSKMQWNGKVVGDRIDGTATQLSKDDKVLRSFWFKGTVKK